MAQFSWLKNYLKSSTRQIEPDFTPTFDYKPSLYTLLFGLWNLIWLLLVGFLLAYLPNSKTPFILFVVIILLGILFVTQRPAIRNKSHQIDE